MQCKAPIIKENIQEEVHLIRKLIMCLLKISRAGAGTIALATSKIGRNEGSTYKMNEASFDDAVNIARQLNLNKESVWEIIKGMKYSSYSELAMAVHIAFSR